MIFFCFVFSFSFYIPLYPPPPNLLIYSLLLHSFVLAIMSVGNTVEGNVVAIEQKSKNQTVFALNMFRVKTSSQKPSNIWLPQIEVVKIGIRQK